MKRLLILIILLSVLSCSRQDKEINIGLVGVYSGRYSEVGVASRNGSDLAVQHINYSGGLLGRKVVTTPIDDKNDMRTIINAFEQHLSSGRHFIIGPNISHMANETMQYAARQDLLIISPTMSTDKLAGIDDNFIRVISVTSVEGMALATKAIDMGLKKAAVIYDNSNAEYTEPIYKMFRTKFEDNGGGIIVYVNHVSNSVKEDFIDMARSIATSEPDILLILTSAIDAAYLAQQIRKIDGSIQLMAGRWAKTPDIISNGGKAVEGMIFTSMYSPVKHTEKYKEFAKEYTAKYNSEPSFVAAYAYEAVMVLAEGIKKAGSLNVAEVKKAITEIYKFEGLEEAFIINKYGDAIRRTSISRISNGAFEVIDD